MCAWKQEACFVTLCESRPRSLKLLHRVTVVNSATGSQQDGVQGNEGSLKDGAEAFVLLLWGTQLVLRSSVLTVLDGECHLGEC